MSDTYHSQPFLKKDGTPDIAKLIATAERCTPSVAGGTAWLDNIRFCKWGPNQWTDGRKHDVVNNPKGAAFPWDGASDCRPFLVDGIINERVAMKTTAFWRALARPGVGDTDASEYSVALANYLVGTVLYDKLTREVELSAQYEEHYGWTILAPRWRREIGLRRAKVTMAMLQDEAQQAQQTIQAAQQPQQTAPGGVPAAPGVAPAPAPGMDPTQPPQPPPQPTDPTQPPAAPAVPPAPIDPQLIGLSQLPQMIMDPTQEAAAVDWFLNWYDSFIKNSLPDDLQDKAPQVSKATATKVVRELRTTGKSSAPIPYLCKDEPEICALKPWDEAFLPPELTDAQEFVIHAERVTEAELRSRIITEDYDEAWVEEAIKQKGNVSPLATLPVGVSGLALSTLGGTQSVAQPASVTGNNEQGLIQILHASYRATDDDNVPGIYMTTFIRGVAQNAAGKSLYAAHGLADSVNGEMLYIAGVREWWCRSVTASRSVAEVASTHQNMVKGFLDAIIDRSSITIMPPINIYESPTGTPYKFGPAQKNYVRHGREPAFLQMPSVQGTTDGIQAHGLVKDIVDNYFGLTSPDVPQPRLLMSQEMAVKRFLILWSRALQQVLGLCQKYMKDADFSDITGAPAGWLDAHRDDSSALSCELHFDPRELDPDQIAKQIEAVNQTVIPQDVLGIIPRDKWTALQLRAINPVWAKELVQPASTASQALFNKAKSEIIQMFAGNTPNFVDVNDPTAASLLQYTIQIVSANPTYLRSLDDPSLVAVLGQNAPQVIQQIGKRHPDPVFSGLLTKWIQNLKFTGVTQPQNKQIGRIGVDPSAGGGAPASGQPGK